MDNITKKTETENLIEQLVSYAKNESQNQKFDHALANLSAAAGILYQYNQRYTDVNIESELKKIAKFCENKSSYHYKANIKKILYYDGFGLDTRGLTVNYLEALARIGYPVAYVVGENRLDKIPRIKNICETYGFYIETYSEQSYIRWIDDLISIFDKHMPTDAFFYTTPNDVSAVVAFEVYDGIVDRYLIDLTDHAFWLGIRACDYFIAGRDMAAFLQKEYRGINKEQQIKLDIDLIPDNTDTHERLPFDVTTKRYIFSGGALYKTLGDKTNTFYKMVESILTLNANVYFLYAGYGDTSQMDKLASKFPNRVFLISERKDFYYLIEHCTLYLNTYPMFGGLMMRYSCLAGKLPLTLKHGQDADGILIEQDKRQIEYTSASDLVQDACMLLNDNDYRRQRETLLKGAVMTSEEFANELKSVLDNHSTSYTHRYILQDVEKFHTEFLERFDLSSTFSDELGRRINCSLIKNFPKQYISGILHKILKKIKG